MYMFILTDPEQVLTYIEMVDNNKVIYTTYLCLGLINAILIVFSHSIMVYQKFSQTMVN